MNEGSGANGTTQGKLDEEALGPKLLGHSGEGSEDPTIIETPSVPSARRSSLPPSVPSGFMPPPQRISLPPQASASQATRKSLIPSLGSGAQTSQSARSSQGAQGSRGSFSHASTAHTVLEALLREEAAKTSAFGRVVAALCVIGFLAQPIAPNNGLQLPLCIVIFLMMLVGLWAWRRGRDEKTYTQRVFRIFTASCVLLSPFLVYYLGVFSPSPLLLTLGMFFFNLADDEKFHRVGSIAAMAMYFALAMLVTTGVLPDLGLMKSFAEPREKVFMALFVPAVLATTRWLARSSRKATLDAILQSNEASRLAAQRQAQLDEANVNLERALKAGAGLGGRYTGMLAGPYRLLEVIGRGAMGEVYAAEHLETTERVAVKLLSPEGLENAALVERFLREGKMARSLVAPNVVRVFEVGAAENGAPFIAMELLSGNDLAFHLRHKKQLDLVSVVDLVLQIGKGLEAAHAARIVHRDLKPQNLFLAESKDARPTWKILDFGVSKLQGSKGTLTQHAVVGTPGYMSPEQAQGTVADHRSDIFSLGAVVYRALTGRPPFSGSDTPQILFEIVYKTPMRASELVTHVPRDVDLVLAIALAKKPDDRFSSAVEFAEAFALSVRGKLPEALREKARALVERHPWGKPVHVQREEKSARRSWLG